MKLICALRDSKAEAFLPPFVIDSRGLAIRSVGDAVNSSENTPLSKHPEDFGLYELATFDELKGIIDPHALPIAVINCIELVGSKNPPLRVAE
ncbi:MAG: nonstructural protein [Microvirus sp.]|nr:MAG: nonstructural protein [Microvirus sp.]